MATFDSILKESGLYSPDEYEKKAGEIESGRQKAIAPFIDRMKARASKSEAAAAKVRGIESPEAPNLEKLPDAPEYQFKDPIQAIGSLGSLLAFIGSLRTRAPLTTSLNAAAAAVEGFHKGDKEAIALERTKWKDSLDKAVKQNDTELKQYEAALQKSGFDITKANAEFHAIAAQNKDDSMLAALESGNYEKQSEILTQRQNLGAKLAQLHEQDDLKRLQIEQTGLYRKAMLDARNAPVKDIPKTTIDYYASQSLMGDNTWQVGLARGKVGQALISAVKDRIPEMAKELGMTPQDSVAMKAKREALFSTMKDRQKYLGAAGQFVGNFQKQADLVEKYMDKGTADGTPIINKWIQSGRVSIAGDPDVTAFDTAVRGLSREHQRIVTGLTSNAQLLASAAQTADELLNRSMTPDQIRSTLAVMREEAQNALDSGKAEVDLLSTQIRTLGSDTATAGKKTIKFGDLPR